MTSSSLGAWRGRELDRLLVLGSAWLRRISEDSLDACEGDVWGPLPGDGDLHEVAGLDQSEHGSSRLAKHSLSFR